MGRPPLTEAQRREADAASKRRILEALAKVISAKGFASVTMQDVATEARVSKTTLYAFFPDRESLLLELYGGLTEAILTAIRHADDRNADWKSRIRAALSTYVSIQLVAGELARSMLVDVPALGLEGLAARRQVLRRYQGLLEQEIHAAESEGRFSGRPTSSLLTAALGGVHELILEGIETGSPLGDDQLEEIIDTANYLVVAAMEHPGR